MIRIKAWASSETTVRRSFQTTRVIALPPLTLPLPLMASSSLEMPPKTSWRVTRRTPCSMQRDWLVASGMIQLFNVISTSSHSRSASYTQWRHQDLKSGGGGQEGGNDWLWGGKHVRVVHIASAKREPIFLNCWGPIFFGQTCARSAHSERVSASRFFLGGKHVRGAHIASA